MASARVYTGQDAVKTECVGETPLTGARKYDHDTPVLHALHWLPAAPASFAVEVVVHGSWKSTAVGLEKT